LLAFDTTIEQNQVLVLFPLPHAAWTAATSTADGREHAMKIGFGELLLAGALILGQICAASLASAGEAFTLTSPAFADDAPLMIKYAGNRAGNPNCVGQSISPPLAWANPPAGTKSFALLLTYPEGRGGLGVVHMVVYGIPASVSGFAEGELSKPSNKFVGGKSTMGLPAYFGPCTPPGDWHHYTFILIATDLDPKALAPGMTRDELFAALNGHTKAAAGLIGRFRHPS
jgi:Raf kinase inhibitor-like YbhB/YbcL family protein